MTASEYRERARGDINWRILVPVYAVFVVAQGSINGIIALLPRTHNFARQLLTTYG